MTLDRKNLILLTIAGLSAILAAWAVRSWISSQEPKVVVQKEVAPKVVNGIQVLVASQQLPAGLIVKKEDLKWQNWPENGLSDTYVTRETGKLDDFVGSVIRQTVAKGEPITGTRVVKAGDRGFLAAVLRPDMRAITIPINSTNSISGLLFPGDHVDLLVTHQVRVGGGSPRRVTETIMTNLRVLAVDARTNSGDGKPIIGKSLTIEVSPKQAEQITVARGIGSFSIALRSVGDTAVASNDDSADVGAKLGKTHTWETDVSPLVGNGAGGLAPQNVVVMRGTKTSSQKFRKVTK